VKPGNLKGNGKEPGYSSVKAIVIKRRIGYYFPL
jgi:hypothetical protein